MRAILLALVFLTPAVGHAQEERYELGRRLKRFEAEWEKTTDPVARKRALTILPKASTQFLSLNLTAAARTVDDAYWALRSAEPPAAGVRWLDSLCVVPQKRAILVSADRFMVTIRHLYTVDGPTPAGVATRLIGPQGAEEPVSLATLPVSVAVSASPSPVGTDGAGPPTTTYDGFIRLRLQLGDTVVTSAVGVSRLDRVGPAVLAQSDIATATAAAKQERLAGVLAGDVPETDLPLSLWQSQPATHSRDNGLPCGRQHEDGRWLVVPTGLGTLTPCRLFSPASTPDSPTPLVVALHGAGGSENMFFESYGAGQIVKECQKRGWLLVSPRSGLLGTPPVAAIIDKLAEHYPIDRKRVFLVGHSLGAGQAIDLVQRHPDTFAAVAVLGGGGRVRQKERFQRLSVFVGVGTADFALRSSRNLVKAMANAGATSVTAKEYPDLEHLVIVREALPDLFRMFDSRK